MKKEKTERHSSIRDTYLTLSQYQRNHNLAYIKFKGDDTVYQSMILKVNPDDRSLVIDELFPSNDGFVGLEGSTISVLVRDKGYSIAFESTINERLKASDSLTYKISMPEFLDKQQRRNAFRIAVENTMNLGAVVAKEEKPIQAKVVNISTSGLRIEVEGQHRDIEEGALLQNLIIRYGDDQTLSCDLDVRNTHFSQDAGECTYIGGRFVGMIEDEQKQLEKYLLKLQRQNRRREVA